MAVIINFKLGFTSLLVGLIIKWTNTTFSNKLFQLFQRKLFEQGDLKGDLT